MTRYIVKVSGRKFWSGEDMEEADEQFLHACNVSSVFAHAEGKTPPEVSFHRTYSKARNLSS